MEEKHEDLLGELLNELPADQVRAVKRINKGSLSAWLTALPIAAENLDLSEVEFWDAMSVRYNKNLIASPIFLRWLPVTIHPSTCVSVQKR